MNAVTLTLSQRALLYLYSTPNMVGCVLALVGLGLFFSGIISSFWWAIVAGLYVAGAIGWPRSELAQRAEQAEMNNELLAQQVSRLIESVAKGLPAEALTLLRNIQATLTELLPKLTALQESGALSAKAAFTVLETVRRYLPDTLSGYLKLPKFYAQMHSLRDGRTASQTLVEQLRLLDGSLSDVARSAFAGDAEALVINGKFLESKFAEKTAFQSK